MVTKYAEAPAAEKPKRKRKNPYPQENAPGKIERKAEYLRVRSLIQKWKGEARTCSFSELVDMDRGLCKLLQKINENEPIAFLIFKDDIDFIQGVIAKRLRQL